MFNCTIDLQAGLVLGVENRRIINPTMSDNRSGQSALLFSQERPKNASGWVTMPLSLLQ
jgi:hypothetical protein